jgi:hypothetical protein
MTNLIEAFSKTNVKIHPIFEEFSCEFTEASQVKNIDYFLDNLKCLQNIEFNSFEKSLLFYCLNFISYSTEAFSARKFINSFSTNGQKNVKVEPIHYSFSRVPFYKAFEKDFDTLINFIDYFNDNINDVLLYKKNSALHLANDIKKTYKEDKLKLLINEGWFLPYQKKKFTIALEHSYLESQLEVKKLKFNKMIKL